MDLTKAEILQQDEELARTMVRQLRSIGWNESNIELALDNIALYRFGPKPSNDKGRYGVWNCVAHTKPGDLVNDDDDPCLLWAVAPFDPDRPDLDPPEVRQ